MDATDGEWIMTSRNDLENFFLQHKEKKFLWVRPGGNHGDYLIYFGLHQLAKKLGLDYEEVDELQLAQTRLDAYDVIYLHGSGGYNDWSSGAAERILHTALGSSSALIVQGPCSVAGNIDYVEGLFDRLGKDSVQRLIFYGREYTTHRLLLESAKRYGFEARLNFDTALFATRASLEHSLGSCKNDYRLYAMREDNEKPTRAIHDFGFGITLDPARYCKNFAHWVKVHARAEEIITTRTHSAVIGAVLGKKTILYPNSYHKNRSIWEYSLRELGVLWGPDTEDRPVRTEALPRWVPSKLRRSYKVRQAILWAHKVPLL
jgi:hypothetical protein